MGRRGPPPKPSAQKRLEGTFRKDRAVKNEVQAPPGAPAKPKDLPKIAAARWDELVPILLDRRTLAVEDFGILEAYCRGYSIWVGYQKEAEKKPIVKTPFGPKVNPAAGEARKWETRLTTMGDRLGLNASARSRVSAKGQPTTPDKKDTTKDFLFGNGKPPPLQVVNGGADGKE